MTDQKELSAVWGKIIKKAWTDEAFKQRLLSHPHDVIKEYKIEIPPNVNIKIVEAPLNTKLILLPPKQKEEIQEEELDKISGGGNWYAN
jgi:hypothetical protein